MSQLREGQREDSLRQEGQKEMPQSLGERIKIFREERHWSQAELAEKISVTRQAVSNWERNKTLPDIYTLQQIVVLFGMTIDELVEGTKEAEAVMPKTPGYLAWASLGAVIVYLILGGITGHLYAQIVAVMVIIGVFIQLFLHLYFTMGVKNGNFSAIAGYDSKVEYNENEVKKVLIQMDTHISCVSFGTILLFGIGAFSGEKRMEILYEALIFMYCIELTASIFYYNYRSIDKTLVREEDRRVSRTGFYALLWFLVWILVFVGATFAKFTIFSIENNSPKAVGYLGWAVLFLIIVTAELLYEQHRVRVKIQKTGSYRPGTMFWLATILAGVVTVMMFCA